PMSASESAARAALLAALPATVREGIEERFNAVREARPPADFSDALGELEHYLDALVDADIIPFDLRVAITEPIGDAWSIACAQLQKKLQLPTPTPASAAMVDADNQGDVEQLMIDILRAVGPVSEREAMTQLLGRLAKRLLEGNPSARAQLQGVLQGIWFTGMLGDSDHESLSERVSELAEQLSARI
ncbi:hypothetical protein, partial [Pseudomonas sp.]|uniref:hypothetical protein n=1 Tax=Pseudomonas sp. TaxID=306 RepID=UPI003981A293